jgi:hypothetical protein
LHGADSPLTSTPFADVYQSEEMVLHVKENRLDNIAMEFLSNKKANRIVKIAMINELRRYGLYPSISKIFNGKRKGHRENL